MTNHLLNNILSGLSDDALRYFFPGLRREDYFAHNRDNGVRFQITGDVYPSLFSIEVCVPAAEEKRLQGLQ